MRLIKYGLVPVGNFMPCALTERKIDQANGGII